MDMHQMTRVQGMTRIQGKELWGIAAFRLRESANKILALADQAESPAMRSKLLSICVRLGEEERELLALARQEQGDVGERSGRSPSLLSLVASGAGDERSRNAGVDARKQAGRKQPRRTPKS